MHIMNYYTKTWGSSQGFKPSGSPIPEYWSSNPPPWGFIFKALYSHVRLLVKVWLPLDFCFLFRIKLIILPQKEKLHVNFDAFEITNLMPNAMQTLVHLTTSYLHLAKVNYIMIVLSARTAFRAMNKLIVGA